MNKEILSRRWCDFQDSLAHMLGINIAVIGPGGKLIALYNGLPFHYDYYHSPELTGLIEGYLIKLTRFSNRRGESKVVEDPLGILAVPVPLEGGLFLVLSGGLNKEKKLCRQFFLERLKEYGLPKAKEISARIRTISPVELQKKAGSVGTIYRLLNHALSKTKKLEEKTTLLAVIDEINKLTATLFGPRFFDLNRFLGLVVSSLIILCDADGGFAFCLSDTGGATVYRGTDKEGFLKGLENKWLTAVEQGKNPIKAIKQHISSGAKKGLGDFAIEKFCVKIKDFLICLGVVCSRSRYVKTVLSSFAQQSLIALEVFSLYALLRQQLGIILNSVRHGIIVINNRGNIMLVNRAVADILAGYGIALLPGKPLDGLGMCQAIKMAIHNAITAGEYTLQKKSVLGEGKNLRYISWDVTPLMRSDKIIGAILVIEDITESESLHTLKEDWERLTTASEVAAGIAHEIRNPLSTAGAAIQLLEKVSEAGRRKELLGKISTELKRMNNILTDFLNLSKPKSNLVLEQVDLLGLIEEMEYLFQSEAYLHNVELIIKRPQSFPPVIGEIIGLKQVFLNIEKNAIEALMSKSVSEGRRLVISFDFDDNNACVSFEDNGPGISPEHLRIIQRPFFTTKKSGTGLGLSISASIIKRMGGELCFESYSGRGTKVSVLLPLGAKNDKK